MRKIKKLVATLLAATMVMAMGVTAFAADNTKTVAAEYEANVTLYKDANCSSTSMGNRGIDNPAEITVYTDGTADFVVRKTKSAVPSVHLYRNQRCSEWNVFRWNQSHRFRRL